jgi:sirohydrochlorin cobaltochelatase
VKRYRHYKQDKAIILSCFGSIIEYNRYLELKEIIEKYFEEIDIFLSFSSRTVLKDLEKIDISLKNLPQVLADVDMLGYKNIIVSSINIFPTDEHQTLKNIVSGFNSFSLANIKITNALLTKTKESSLFLQDLDKKISLKDTANLYIIHGCPTLAVNGLDSITYCTSFLEKINTLNYTCSLEGSFPFYAIKDNLISKMKKNNIKKIQIIPMLLVSGNHYIKDMHEIKDELSIHFDTSIVKSITKGEKFNLIELEIIKDIILNNINEEVVKLGH